MPHNTAKQVLNTFMHTMIILLIRHHLGLQHTKHMINECSVRGKHKQMVIIMLFISLRPFI